jgi:hypothetical protein
LRRWLPLRTSPLADRSRARALLLEPRALLARVPLVLLVLVPPVLLGALPH